MAVCQIEQDHVNQIKELIADVAPSSDATPQERAQAQRLAAPLRHQLMLANIALANCRKSHSVSEIRLHVIRMANDDGSNQTLVNPQNVQEWVRVVNLVFAPARLRVLFDPMADFESRNNSRLNRLVEGTGLQTDTDAVADAEVIGDQFPDRVVVICRTGRLLSAPPFGNCGPGCGFSWFPGKYIMMPAFDPGFPTILAHELGHYLGLPHTFRYVIDTTADAGVIFNILGNDLAALEGDSSVVSDTPAEMIIRDQDAGTNTSIMLNGKTINFLRKNVMSYFRPLTPTDRTITAGQATRVQAVLQQRRAAGLAVSEVMS